MDVHKESISIAVMNGAGKIVMESLIETKASMILQFIDGLRGDVHVTFEEGTSAAWLYDLLKPHVTKLVVCDPRKNASMREGNQSDKIDARRLAELLRLNHLHPVYHGEHGLRSLKELVRSYLTITKDLVRISLKRYPYFGIWFCGEPRRYNADDRVGQRVEIYGAGEDLGIGAEVGSPEIF
jgi:transposase